MSAKTPYRAVAGFISAAVALSGCTSLDVRKSIGRSNEEATAKARELNKAAPPSAVEESPGYFLLGQKIPAGRKDPEFLRQDVHLATAKPLSLEQAALQITQMTSIPVSVQPAALEYVKQRGKEKGQQQQASPFAQILPGSLASTIPALPNTASENPLEINLNYKGSLRGLLDTIVAQAGIFWNYEKDQIRFYLTETRVFEISALPTVSGAASSISNAGSFGGTSTGGAGGSQNGSSSQSAFSFISIDHYKSIENSIKTVLKQTGGSAVEQFTSVSLDPSSGQLVVTATPPELEAVEQYVRTINSQMARNVLVDVNVYQVDLNASDQFGFNLNAALTATKGNIVRGVALQGAGTQNPQAGRISAAIASSDWNASAFADALAQYGRVSLVTRGTVIALNGQPTPMQVSRSQGYLASSTSTVVQGVGVTTTLTPGNLVSGFSATFMPLIRGDRILLEYAINITQNLGLNTVSSGGSTIQTPNSATQAMVQRAVIKSGDTIVLSGFEQTENSTNDSIGFLSASTGGRANHSILVITMRVMNLGG